MASVPIFTSSLHAASRIGENQELDMTENDTQTHSNHYMTITSDRQ